jgi:hypothetical protein
LTNDTHESLPVFAPINDADKARDFGYVEGKAQVVPPLMNHPPRTATPAGPPHPVSSTVTSAPYLPVHRDGLQFGRDGKNRGRAGHAVAKNDGGSCQQRSVLRSVKLNFHIACSL